MALLWMDGFDIYGPHGTNALSELVSSGYANGSGGTTQSDTRTGQGLSLILVSSALFKPLSVNADEIIFGFAYKRNASTSNTVCGVVYDNGLGGQTPLFEVAWNTFGQVRAHVGSVGGGGPLMTQNDTHNIIRSDTWHYIEVKYHPDPTSGSLIVKVDGSTIINFTGVTAPAMMTQLNIVYLTTNASVASFFDDFYICDTLGGEFDDFLGEVVVYALIPESDESPNELTQVGGGSGHYTTQDEAPSDEDTSYLHTDTASQQEMFGLPDIPGSLLSVLAVQVSARVRKTDEGLVGFKIAAEVDTDEVLGDTINAVASYQTHHMLMVEAPAGGSWAVEDVDGLKIGYKTVG